MVIPIPLSPHLTLRGGETVVFPLLKSNTPLYNVDFGSSRVSQTRKAKDTESGWMDRVTYPHSVSDLIVKWRSCQVHATVTGPKRFAYAPNLSNYYQSWAARTCSTRGTNTIVMWLYYYCPLLNSPLFSPWNYLLVSLLAILLLL